MGDHTVQVRLRGRADIDDPPVYVTAPSPALEPKRREKVAVDPLTLPPRYYLTYSISEKVFGRVSNPQKFVPHILRAD